MLEQTKYLSHDTIQALTTATGGALIAIRISGPLTRQVIKSQLQAKRPLIEHPREMIRCRVKDQQGVWLDDAVACFFAGPASYTGEDVLEVFLHGSHFIASRFLESLSSHGIRGALPGEFSFRAVRNGKLSLSQAQAVADLIGVSNDQALSLSLEKLEGSQKRILSALGDRLKKTAAYSELGIDFSDQDVHELGIEKLKSDLREVIEELQRLSESFARGSRIQDGVRIAITGLPNAGKSSFFNALLGEDRSIVSDIAGTTRDTIRETLTLDQITFRLEDTAGLRDVGDSIERLGIERTLRAARNADILIFVVDPSSQPAAIDGVWESLGFSPSRALGILAKSDLNSEADRNQFRLSHCFKSIPRWVETSAVTHSGMKSAANALVEISKSFVERSPGELLLTRVDQKKSAEAAIEHLQRAQTSPSLDLFANDLRQALHSLAPLIGETLPDDILGMIFSEFCIGK